MLDNTVEAKSFMQGKMSQDLDEEWVDTLAVVGPLEVIAEAANRVPDDEQRRHPAIPWSQVIGLRNRLVHGYDSIDLDVLWQIAVRDLDPLIASLEAIVGGN